MLSVANFPKNPLELVTKAQNLLGKTKNYFDKKLDPKHDEESLPKVLKTTESLLKQAEKLSNALKNQGNVPSQKLANRIEETLSELTEAKGDLEGVLDRLKKFTPAAAHKAHPNSPDFSRPNSPVDFSGPGFSRPNSPDFSRPNSPVVGLQRTFSPISVATKSPMQSSSGHSSLISTTSDDAI